MIDIPRENESMMKKVDKKIVRINQKKFRISDVVNPEVDNECR